MRHQRRNMLQLRRLTLQEFAPGRCVEEQVLHCNRRSRREPRLFHPQHLPARNLYERSSFFIFRTRLERHPSYARDARQRLPAKPQRRNRQQIVRGPQLRRRMPLERQQRIVPHHPAPVIRNPDQLSSARLHLDPDPRRPRIQRVLQQLLHHRRRPFHHLPGSYLVRDLVRQNPYPPHPSILRFPHPGAPNLGVPH